MKYYLVGIKGTGMTSLALFLKDLGHFVVGSDNEKMYFTDKILKSKKIEVFIFNENNITDEYTYIIGNAYDEKNEEIRKIILNDFEHYYYHEFIGKIIEKNIIAISGTHGKTTTSYFLSQMFNKEASYIIGDGSGYGTRESNLLILEACEYRDHFLSYYPIISIITNIELDHPDYFKNEKMLLNSFNKFANHSSMLVVNNDCKNAKRIKHKNKVTFGFSEGSDFKIKINTKTKNGYIINLENRKEKISNNYKVPFFGKHHIYDFVGALIVCLLMDKTPYLEKLSLPKRRFEETIYGNTILIDDYAHHPTEIKCLYESIREKYPTYKINVIFQMHTYSRTLAYRNEFKKVLNLFDKVYLEKTFTSTREKENEETERKINQIFNNFETFDDNVLKLISKSNKEVWVFLGAGIVNQNICKLV